MLNNILRQFKDLYRQGKSGTLHPICLFVTYKLLVKFVNELLSLSLGEVVKIDLKTDNTQRTKRLKPDSLSCRTSRRKLIELQMSEADEKDER